MSPGQLTDQWHTYEKLDELNRYRRLVSLYSGRDETFETFWTRRRFWDALIDCRSLNFCTAHRIQQFSRPESLSDASHSLWTAYPATFWRSSLGGVTFQ